MKKMYGMCILLTSLTVLLATPSFLHAQLVFTYAGSDEIIANPERGLQKYSITDNSNYTITDYSNIDETAIRDWRDGPEKVTVIYRYFVLGGLLDSEISETYLDNIQTHEYKH